MYLIKWLLSAHQQSHPSCTVVSEMPCGIFTLTEDHLHKHLLQVEYRQRLGGKMLAVMPSKQRKQIKTNKVAKKEGSSLSKFYCEFKPTLPMGTNQQ